MQPDTPLNPLPPGPYKYRPCEYDDWGVVRDANQHIVANVCPPHLANDFQKLGHQYNSPEWHAGPPQARAVAELLIRAWGEQDGTKLSNRILDADFTYEDGLGWCLRDETDKGSFGMPAVYIRWDADDFWWIYLKTEYRPFEVAAIKTLGELRTWLRLLGITLTETA